MPPSRYPRSSQRLAPAALRDVLTATVPRRLLDGAGEQRIRFADLDETAWERFRPATCQRLAQEIVKRVRVEMQYFPSQVVAQRLPLVTAALHLEDLEVEPRTYNCLCKMQMLGLLNDVAELSNKTIKDLLEVTGFGAKCLVDLLTCLETLSVRGADHVAHGGTADAVAEPSLVRWTSPVLAPFSSFRYLRLPKLPDRATLADLDLDARTRGCLTRLGFHERPSDLEESTVAEMLTLPGFSVRCLTDLLQAIDALRSGRQRARPGPVDRPVPDVPEVVVDQHSTLEAELQSLMERSLRSKRGPVDPRNVQMAVRYFGFDGSGGETLRAIGDSFRLTRERVRQICDRVRAGVKRSKMTTRLLDTAVDHIVAQLPCEASRLEESLRANGLATRAFRLEGLLQAIQLLGRSTPFVLEDVSGRRMALHPERDKIARRVLGIAKRAIAHLGVATISDVAAIVEEHTSAPATPEFIASILQGRPGFEWLDEQQGWFWLQSTLRNRVVGRIRKILSVADSIEVAELRSGIARHHAMKGYAPPRRVLVELCKRLPECRVDGNWVRSKKAHDWRNVLRGTEYAFAAILTEHGPVMQRAKFEELCLAQGMNRSTFYAYLDYSPIIERFAPGVYGLRGAPVAPGEVEALVPSFQRPRTVRLDHGWTPDRRIWIGYRLSENMLKSGSFSVPGAMKQCLQGSFSLTTADGQTIGAISVRDCAAWGLGPFFRRRGGDAGDVVLILFDLGAKVAQVSIGDDDLLDPYQTAEPR